jgi:prepilin-type N-terminal cleavage/methylation domain-containing protein
MTRPTSPRASGFTLVEILVSIAVLALLIALIGQLFNNASSASSISTTHLEADARVRLLFARMATDFSHIVKRPDVDYYFKSSANTQTGNDQMALFSEVSGYSSTSDAQNAVSLVSYRVNTTGTAPCIERMGKALSWGGGATVISTPGATPILPLPFLPVTIAGNWPAAETVPTSTSTSDPGYDLDYETIVPNAFRFEYYYLLTSGALSATPWDTVAGHTAINGLQDVAGIGVVIAVTDRKASAIATSSSLTSFASNLSDWPPSSGSAFGSLQTSWQTAASSSTTLPVAVRNGIRVYEQLFPINTPSQ